MKNTLLVLLLAAVALTACKSTQAIIEEGNYDQAIEQALRKLVGKKKKKADVVNALEIAFEKATAEDTALINRLKAEGRSENWSKVYSAAKRIESRQRDIEPLLPLVDDRGRKADFKFVRTGPILAESKGKAANHFYNSADALMRQARQGDKVAAREAYHQLERIGQYYERYKNTSGLLNEARDLGVSRVLFRMENVSNSILPRDFEREVLRTDVQNMNELWREYYTRDGGQDFDYEIVMKLQDIDVSPEAERIRDFDQEKEIEDGEEALRDAQGNVQKDTSGNIIKVPVKKFVRATVTETYLNKAAIIGGTLVFYDKRKREILDTKPLGVEAVFEHYSTRFRGDRRALSDDVVRNLDNRLIPFPPDEVLLMDAADLLKPIIKEKIVYAGFF